MDNMRSHHVKAVQEVLVEKGMKALYLPPYTPDLNPIEKMWSKMKALPRGWKVRSLALLPD
jgi:transposase